VRQEVNLMSASAWARSLVPIQIIRTKEMGGMTTRTSLAIAGLGVLTLFAGAVFYRRRHRTSNDLGDGDGDADATPVVEQIASTETPPPAETQT
jgi:LPXTG-motif cell wall-anchored protein